MWHRKDHLYSTFHNGLNSQTKIPVLSISISISISIEYGLQFTTSIYSTSLQTFTNFQFSHLMDRVLSLFTLFSVHLSVGC